jgi:hypothetical protein
MSDLPKEDTNRTKVTAQKITQTKRSKVLENCNVDESPEVYTDPVRDPYYYLKYKINLWLNGEGIAIEYTNKVDLDYYCQMWRWDMVTAISLSLGQSPVKITRFWHRFSEEFKQRYEERMVLLREAIEHRLIPYDMVQYKSYIFFNRIHAVVRPLHFAKWAKERNWELFFDIEESIRKYDTDMDFEGRCRELEQEVRLLKQEMTSKTKMDANPLGVRREESYQKLIAGLAMLKYPHLPSIPNFLN